MPGPSANNSPGLPVLDQVTAYAAAHPIATAILSVLALALLVLAWFTLRAVLRTTAHAAHALTAAVRGWAADRTTEDILTMVAASIATGVSAQGMWRFSGDVLGLDGPLRLVLFGFIEVAVVTSAVRARRSMRDNYSAGVDGIAVWAFAVLTAVLSAMDATLSGKGLKGLAEAAFRLAAPLVAAWLWERGMAIERRRIRGRSSIHWRLTPERILVRLGLAEATDRTAGEVDTQRRLTRVALASDRAHQLREAGGVDAQAAPGLPGDAPGVHCGGRARWARP
ncbi:hypothetical protein B1L11_23265 [Microbispora sp. GKU 823]|nr:hypothetical protein B1L11_23265 [Microbispora sp. GKU 823]